MLAMIAIFMAGFSLAIDALLLYGKRVREDKRAATALATAKKTLIAYAVVRGVPLPCPFLGTVQSYLDGPANPAGACGNPDIGLLPWTALQLPPLRDGENAPIWYARADCTTDVLKLDGMPAIVTDPYYAAILIAPGGPLSGQTRVLTDPVSNAMRDTYLEQAPFDFVLTGGVPSTFNDRVLGILCSELR